MSPAPLEQESAYAFEQISVTDSAQRLSLTNVLASPKPKKVVMFLEGAPVRYRVDGTSPDSSTGAILTPYSTLTLRNANDMFNFRAIRDGTTNGTLNVHYYRNK